MSSSRNTKPNYNNISYKTTTIKCWKLFLIIIFLHIFFVSDSSKILAESLPKNHNCGNKVKLSCKLRENMERKKGVIILQYDPERKNEVISIGKVDRSIIEIMCVSRLNNIDSISRGFRSVYGDVKIVFCRSPQNKNSHRLSYSLAEKYLKTGNEINLLQFEDLIAFRNTIGWDFIQFHFTPYKDIFMYVIYGDSSNLVYAIDSKIKKKSVLFFKGTYPHPINPDYSNKGTKISAFVGYWPRHLILFNAEYRIKRNQIIGWNNFLLELKKHDNPEVKFVWDELDTDTRKIISQFDTSNEIDDKLKVKIIKGLNRYVDDILHLDKIKLLDLKIFRGKDYYDSVYQIMGDGSIGTRKFNTYILRKIFPDNLRFCYYQGFEMPLRHHLLYKKVNGTFSRRIPHKCWSPDDKKILFVGALEKDWHANVYTVDVETKKTEKLLEKDDTSRNFNPDLEWTENGMVITCKDAIYVRDVKAWQGKKGKVDENKVQKLDIPSGITDMCNGRISHDGDKLMFFGVKNNAVYLFIYNLKTNGLMEKELGRDTNMENYQGAWIYPGKMSIIKNQYEYQRFRGLEDLRK